MIIQSFDLLLRDPAAFFLLLAIVLAGLVIGFTVHEFCHAATALGEGDDTARRMGRLTLNPIKHIHPIGFILIIVVGFGWARPVQVDHYNLRHGRLGMAWVALAGPLSNFAIAFALSQGFRFGLFPAVISPVEAAGLGEVWGFALFFIIFANFVLGIVNLVPVPPLDGSKVLGGLLPERLYYPYLAAERYTVFALLSVVITSMALSFIDGRNILSEGLLIPVSFLMELAIGPNLGSL